MLKFAVLATIIACAAALRVEEGGTEGTFFQREETHFSTVIVDEDVIGPGVRARIAVLEGVVGQIRVRALNANGGGFGAPNADHVLSPGIDRNDDGNYDLTIQLAPAAEFPLYPNGPDPRFFLEIEDEFEYPDTLAVVIHNAKGTPIRP